MVFLRVGREGERKVQSRHGGKRGGEKERVRSAPFFHFALGGREGKQSEPDRPRAMVLSFLRGKEKGEKGKTPGKKLGRKEKGRRRKRLSSFSSRGGGRPLQKRKKKKEKGGIHLINSTSPFPCGRGKKGEGRGGETSLRTSTDIKEQ